MSGLEWLVLGLAALAVGQVWLIIRLRRRG